jgi:hypothetical protein
VAAVDAVAATGARLRTVSRYLGAVSVNATLSSLERLSRLPGVAGLDLVGGGMRREPPIPKGTAWPTDTLDYGGSEPFLEQIQIVDIHGLGFTGRGVLVGMLDTGFYRGHVALDELDVQGEWDFIHDDGCTQNEAGQDVSNQHNHGTSTLSVVGAWDPGRMIGAAPGASFLLGKTEEVSSETPVEEDYWVEGLEWAEAEGADVVSSSLGYIDWYDYDDLDGQTAVTTRAARVAARKGVVLCNSMGNEGLGPGSLIAPADAESILAVGAVSLSGTRAGFSSTGPTADGRVKPDVMACGVSVWAATPSDSSYTWASGTSMAAPLVAGAVAVLLEARPTWTPVELMDAIRTTATRAAAPDNYYGWGVVQALSAYLPGDTLLAVVGQVRDAWSGGGVEEAWIGWRPIGGSVWEGPAFSDAEGRFTLSLAAGSYELLVQAIGYRQRLGDTLVVPVGGQWSVTLEPVPVAVGPNPCTGVLSFSLGVMDGPARLELELWDVAGRRVAREELSGNAGALRANWDLGDEGLPPGRFILRWRSGTTAGSLPVLYLGAQR